MLPREELFFRILLFFAVFSIIALALNLAAIPAGASGSITINDFASAVSGINGVGLAGVADTVGGGSYQESANTAHGILLTGLDFTTATAINQNVTTLIGGQWTLTAGQGLILTTTPLISGVFNPSAIILRNVQSSGNVYTVNSLIDNSVAGGDFYVFPRYIFGYSAYDLKVIFASDGVHIKKFPLTYGILDAGDDYFYPMPGASNTIPGGSNIATALTEVTATRIGAVPEMTSNLAVSKDGVLLFSVPVRSIYPGDVSNDKVRHGGAGSDYKNFVVKGFPSTPMLSTQESLTSNEGSLINPLSAIGMFLNLLGAAFGVSQAAVVPWWLWAIVGTPCITTMSLIYIEIWRGV